MKPLHFILGVPAISLLLVGVFLVFPVAEFEDVEFVKAETREPFTLLFVGDIMLDRYIRTVLDSKGPAFVFGGVSSLLSSPDITIGNLEGPITNGPSRSVGTMVGHKDNMRFTFAPTTASMLAGNGFDVVSIGNNHINDAETIGIESTKRYLTASGIVFVGDPLRTTKEPVVREIKGYRIGFVGYNQFYGADEDHTLQVIQDARRQNLDAVVVLAHWGEEYTTTPPLEVRALAQKMSDAGATLIIGTHSHVIGESEDIGNTRVYYSLGNFVFDQYFDENVRCGLAVGVTLTEEEVEYTETRIGMHEDGRTDLVCS